LDISFSDKDSTVLLHHFTIDVDGAVLKCVSGAMYSDTYYFVLEDDQITKIIPAKQVGVPIYLAKQTNPYALVARVLEAPGLSIEVLSGRLRSARQRELSIERSREPLPLLQVFPKQTRRQILERQHFELLASRYDAAMIEIGATRNSVIQQLGIHRFEIPLGSDHYVSIYGQDADVGHWAVPFVLIEFTDDSVVAIYTIWTSQPPSLDK
jgi:hypothetical protein